MAGGRIMGRAAPGIRNRLAIIAEARRATGIVVHFAGSDQSDDPGAAVFVDFPAAGIAIVILAAITIDTQQRDIRDVPARRPGQRRNGQQSNERQRQS